ncbi:atl2 [Symbiodinium pilosum]|uniref:Atl2 protein n=1 Tax=Symbiodinium pilosum TaxID=2952 RepID=A0A812WLH9_SYMPI|nr:atl2 [Symbiodinium pilosum]
MQIQLLSGCFVSTAAQASVASPSFLRNGNTAVVCTPLFTIAQASSCPAECNDLKAASATALQRAELDLDAAESATDYSRFCMQNCVHDSASTESLCTPASDAPARAPIVSPAALLNEGAEQMEKPDKDVAKAKDKKEEAVKNEEKIASVEASLASANEKAAANLALAHSRGDLFEEVKTELQHSAERAGAYAAAAKKAADLAEEEAQEIAEVPKAAAKEAAEAAIKQFQQQDQLNKKFLSNLKAHATPTLPPTPVAAAVAAAPYRAAIRQVESTQGLYENKAAQLKSEADLLKASSDSAHSQVHAYQAAGNVGAAQKIQTQAHDLLVRSLEKETEAAEAMDEARRIGLMVPKYAAAAADAAARASILGSQKWMPPSYQAVPAINAKRLPFPEVPASAPYPVPAASPVAFAPASAPAAAPAA